MTNVNTINTTMITIKVHTTQATATQEAMEQASSGQATRSITARFKNPARAAHLNIPAGAWANLAAAQVPDSYRPILDAVLESAAKAVISRHLSQVTYWPSTLDASLFGEASLLDEATGANSDWMTKEEIEAAWRESATRKAWVTSPNYSANQAFRKAVAHYENLVSRLAGKTSQYTPTDLDLILAKLRAEDITTELGSFIVRRVDAIKNRPQRSEAVNTDLL